MNKNQAISEKNQILNSELDFSSMYVCTVRKYVNTTEYLAVLDILNFFLIICPKTLDKKKALEFFECYKEYLMGLRYIDDSILNIIEGEQTKVNNLFLQNVTDFFNELMYFTKEIFMPQWLSKWDRN